MSKKMILSILLISIVLIIVFAVFGVKFLHIPSISQLVQKNKEVNQQVDTVSTLTTVEYPETIKKLENTEDSLELQKEKYEELTEIANNKGNVYVTEKFDIGYLWTKIGKYATKNNIGLSIDVKKSSETDLYNLNFTIKGTFTQIISFLKTIENDSELSFRIYNFKLVPGKGVPANTTRLEATFTVRDVNINASSLSKQTNINLNNTMTTQNNTVSNNTTVNE